MNRFFKEINEFYFKYNVNSGIEEQYALIYLIQDVMKYCHNFSYKLLKRINYTYYDIPELLHRRQYNIWKKLVNNIRNFNIYKSFNYEKDENFFYEIPIISMYKKDEFILKYPILDGENTIPIPNYLISLDSDIKKHNYQHLEDKNIFNNREIFDFNSDIFRRYVRDTETTILNDNKEAVNIVDIKDTLSPILTLTTKDNLSYFHKKMNVIEDRPYFFNPNIAKILNCRTVTMDMFMDLFNVNKFELRDKIIKIKEKQINLLMIGLGGTMSNFCYFMNELAKEFKLDNLFNLITLYEQDQLELSNIFRIPLDYVTPIFYNTEQHTREANINSDYIKKIPFKSYMLLNCKNLYANLKLNFSNFKIFSEELSDFNYIIGSPDISTRVKLTNLEGLNFICPLHYNNELVVLTNPSVEEDELMSETYGSIHLSYFFMNMFKMTLTIIDLMLKDELNQNETVLNYSSKEDLENIKQNVSRSNNSYIIC